MLRLSYGSGRKHLSSLCLSKSTYYPKCVSICRNASGQPYADVYAKKTLDSIGRDLFWAKAAEDVRWRKEYSRVVDISNSPFTRWFPDAELNVCENALDVHVDAGNGEKLALIYDSPITSTKKKFTYNQLLHEVSRLARVLVNHGVGRGDRVLIYMPMIPQAVMGMLACARIGATHSVVFGGFAAKELSTRIAHAQPKVILSASCGLEPSRIIHYKPILDEAIALSKVQGVQTIVHQREDYPPLAELKKGVDFNWAESVDQVTSGHDAVPLPSNHPLYILYTSGTTGTPKGVVRGSGGHAVVLKWSMSEVFGMGKKAGSTGVWWAASDLGWVVGHSYICYAPLLKGLTTVLYEGKPVGTPDAAQFYRVISEYGVEGMFTSPTAIRAIKIADPQNNESRQYSRKTLQHVFVAGEHCDMESRLWAQKSFGVPVLDNWWQTESGSPISATCVGLGNPTDPPEHSCGFPLPGYQLEVLRDDGSPAKPGELGRIVSKLPTPPGFMDTLYLNDSLFKSAYFTRYPGYYDTMDAGMIAEDGNVYVMARDDDVINVAGHRLSTSALEEVILEHPLIAEVAVIGVPDKLKGQLPLALFVLKSNANKSSLDKITKELILKVRESIGAVAAFKLAITVPALPRTRSGKTPRKTIADLADNKSVKIPPTIENAEVYGDILLALQKIGFGDKASFNK